MTRNLRGTLHGVRVIRRLPFPQQGCLSVSVHLNLNLKLEKRKKKTVARKKRLAPQGWIQTSSTISKELVKLKIKNNYHAKLVFKQMWLLSFYHRKLLKESFFL